MATEFPGKVRKILYWPFGLKNILVSEKEQLSMWDMGTKMRSNSLPLPCSMLELASLQIGGQPYLVVLAANGMHYFFRYSDSEEQLNRDASYEVLAHPGLENNQNFGVLTALNNVIASSIGTGIYMQEVATQGRSYHHIDTNKFLVKGLTNKIITALQLVSRSHLIIASSRLRGIFVVDIAAESLVQSITLDCHPCYLSYSQGADLLLIHDPLTGTRFFKAFSMSLVDIPKFNIHERAADPLTPVYISLCETGRFALVTQNQSLFLHDVWNGGSLVYSVHVPCVRLFSIALVLDYTSNVRIFAAVRPELHSKTWAIRSWDICITPTIQSVACQGDPTHRSCLTCFQDALLNPGGPTSGEGCRFINFRLFRPSNPSTPECFRSLPLISSGKAWYERLEYNPCPPIQNEKSNAVLRWAIANSLQLSFEAELKHVQHNHLHIRSLPSDVYSTCDICYMGLFFGVWYCAYCGFEVCAPCHSDMVSALERPRLLLPCTMAHAQTWLFPVSYFTEQQLQGILVDLKTIASMRTMIIDSGCPIPVQPPLKGDDGIDDRYHPILRYKLAELTEEILIGLWVRRIPFVVSEASELCATPSQLFDLAKDDECTVEHFDGFLWHSTKTIIKDYFQEWLQAHAWARHIRVYPNPDAAQKFEHFLQRLSPQYFSSQGPLNLISHLPKSHIAPKSGPMLRISEKDSMATGSQFLQVNFTGKVDALLHSQAATFDGRKGARWDIWPHSSIPLLGKLLDPNATLLDCELGGPMSRASYYLGKDRLTDAASAGAIPWTCILNPGEVLFIPSGCPHQVSNLSNCIYLTKNILPITDVPFIQKLQPMLRHGNLSSKKLKHKDQVRLDLLLWYSWLNTSNE